MFSDDIFRKFSEKLFTELKNVISCCGLFPNLSQVSLIWHPNVFFFQDNFCVIYFRKKPETKFGKFPSLKLPTLCSVAVKVLLWAENIATKKTSQMLLVFVMILCLQFFFKISQKKPDLIKKSLYAVGFHWVLLEVADRSEKFDSPNHLSF